jgi:translation initiation factor 2 alpha subunit (eIF-2alpha)
MEINKISTTGLVANNLMFILADMIESCHKVSEEEARKCNFHLDKKTQKALQMIRFGAKDLRKRTTEIGDKSQDSFGKDSDMLFKLLLTAVDRTDSDYKVIELITKYAEAFESQIDLKINKFGV